MNQIALSDDLNIITAEINSYKQLAGQAIFEIGRRLKYVKENDLAHGQFGSWLDRIGFDKFQASRFIKVFEELGDSNLLTSANLSFRVLYEISTLPKEQREKPHIIPSTGEKKTVDEMTVRQLQEIKKAWKESEKAKQEAEQQVILLQDKLKKEQSKPPKVIEKEVPSPSITRRIKELEQQLKAKEEELQRVEAQKKRAEDYMKMQEKDAEQYRKLKEQVEFLYSQRDNLHRQIESATALSGMVVEIEHFLQTKLAPIKYSRAFERLDSPVALRNIEDIVTKVEDWCKDIRSLLPQGEYIELEVIPYE